MTDNCSATLPPEQFAFCFYDAHPWIIWVKVACLFLAFIVPIVLVWKRPPDAMRPSTLFMPPIAWAYFMFLAFAR